MSYSVVILSRDPRNCSASVMALYKQEPDLPRERIIVVDDGAREKAEANCPRITWLQGEKPFIYARNLNIGLRHAFDVQGVDGAIALNDDALLETKRGFTMLDAVCQKDENLGLLSPAINSVGNPNQQFKGYDRVRSEPRMLCFVSVYVPRRTWLAVGELDERFTEYGLDDDDYSLRVRNAGLKLGVWDGCKVDHLSLNSSYRGEAGAGGDYGPNLEIFKQKWGMDNFGRPA
jgi:GT2 family glycosyltransferase